MRIHKSKAMTLWLYIGVLAYSLVTQLHARPIVPESEEFTVANLSGSNLIEGEQDILKAVSRHIFQGQFPGNANGHFGKAKALLNRFKDAQDLRYQYLKAKVLQHQHQFDEARQWLDKVTESDPTQINAWLLKANIDQTQGKWEQASHACRQLAGLTDNRILSACLLDIQGNKESPEKSYDILSQVLRQRPSDEPSLSYWFQQILAEQALKMEKPEDASQWLSADNLRNKPLSYAVLWADIQLALGRNQILLNTLTRLFESTVSIDDALLLRAVMAEKALGKTQWAHQLEQQINQRILRRDRQHASDIARYFLDIKPDPLKALRWAEINWQQARLHEDLKLLTRARAAVEGNTHG